MKKFTEPSLETQANGASFQFASHILEQQENERREVAHRLHDGLAQELAGALMRFEMIVETCDLPQNIQDNEVPVILASLQNALSEARLVMSSLRPPVLDELGIVAAIEHLMSDWSHHSTQLHFQSSLQSERFPTFIETMLFRICEDSIRHAVNDLKSSSLHLRMSELSHQLILEIRINGVQASLLSNQDLQLTLSKLESRAKACGGVLAISTSLQNISSEPISGASTGMTIRGKFPLPNISIEHRN